MISNCRFVPGTSISLPFNALQTPCDASSTPPLRDELSPFLPKTCDGYINVVLPDRHFETYTSRIRYVTEGTLPCWDNELSLWLLRCIIYAALVHRARGIHNTKHAFLLFHQQSNLRRDVADSKENFSRFVLKKIDWFAIQTKMMPFLH